MNDPIELLRQWIDDAGGSAVIEAIAMCVATADTSARPSARIVLLRGLDQRGLQFFTSYESRKGRELSKNPFAAAVFYWPALQRQVRVEGEVSELPENESDAYFNARPRGHRVAAWASEQSASLDSYAALEERFTHFDARFDEEVPRPYSWGGYLLAPSRIEFWQGRPNRMHERMLYTRLADVWDVTRLQP